MSITKDQFLRVSLAAIVSFHSVVVWQHAAVQLSLPVSLLSGQTAFAASAVIVMPLLGAVLLWTKRAKDGAIMIPASMFASLLCGLLNPFVLNSPGYALVAVTETVGSFMGAVAFRDVVRVRETSLIAPSLSK